MSNVILSVGTLVNVRGDTKTRWRVTHVNKNFFRMVKSYNLRNEKTGKVWLNVPESQVEYAI